MKQKSQWPEFRRAELATSGSPDVNPVFVDVDETIIDFDELKLKNLFQDAFGEHLDVNLSSVRVGSPAHRIIPGKLTRVVLPGGVSAVFSDLFLDGFRLSKDINSDTGNMKKPPSGNWKLLRGVICQPSIDFHPDAAGLLDDGIKNDIKMLVGNPGQGKTLFIRKILSDWAKNIDGIRDCDGEATPIIFYVDMEQLWPKKNGGFEPITGKFWQMLVSGLINVCKIDLRTGSTASIIKGDPPFGEKIASFENKYRDASGNGNIDSDFWKGLFRDLCRVLPCYKKYAIIAIDNLDRFEFSEVRYSFFEECKNDVSKNIDKNISDMIADFIYPMRLGKISAKVIIACRWPVYHHLTEGPEVRGDDACRAELMNCSKWQLIDPSPGVIFKPRNQTIQYWLKQIKSRNAIRSDLLRDFQRYFDVMTKKNDDAQARGVIGQLLELSRQGARDVVEFLAAFTFDTSRRGELIRRLMGKQPQHLIRLYITNWKNQYKQSSGHFPNLFLNDCSADRGQDIIGQAHDAEFYKAVHQPHKQTYWAKWIVMRYIYAHEVMRNVKRVEIDFEKLYHALHEVAGYESNLIRLVIGSLASPNDAGGCLSVRYRGGSRYLSLTRRGRALVGDGDGAPPFCFQFNYLQLVIDDELLSFPDQWADEFVTDCSLDYVSKMGNDYIEGMYEYFEGKMPAVLLFLRILECSWGREECRINGFDKRLKQLITPNFGDIKSHLGGVYKRLLENKASPRRLDKWSHDREKVRKKIEEMQERLENDLDFMKFWRDLSDRESMVIPNEY